VFLDAVVCTRSPEGRLSFLRCNTAPFKMPDQTVVGTVVLVQDVTADKAADPASNLASIAACTAGSCVDVPRPKNLATLTTGAAHVAVTRGSASRLGGPKHRRCSGGSVLVQDIGDTCLKT
jgi:hypothetical protein